MTINSPGNVSPSKDKPMKMFNKIVEFIGLSICNPVCEISNPSVKMEYIRSQFDYFQVDYIYGMDYNFEELTERKYKTVFCLEVIEHLQNPLLFMQNVIKLMDTNCDLYVSMPGRPRLLWPKFHYFEIPPKHFNKWILEPLGLKIIRKKRILVQKKFSFKIGFRPIIRLFMLPINGTWIYHIKRISEVDNYVHAEL